MKHRKRSVSDLESNYKDIIEVKECVLKKKSMPKINSKDSFNYVHVSYDTEVLRGAASGILACLALLRGLLR
jgi:hypothetical protein